MYKEKKYFWFYRYFIIPVTPNYGNKRIYVITGENCKSENKQKIPTL